MKKIRIVVVDDSAFSRRSITRMLEGLDTVEIVGFAGNGEEGIQKVIALKPDLVTLDLEMPKMDGFTLLRILTTRFSVPVIVISALSGADKVFKALELGALDFVAKPSGTASIDLLSIKEDLQKKVRQIIDLRSKKTPRGIVGNTRGEVDPTTPALLDVAAQYTGIDLVAIGSSTGGPPALQQIITSFERKYPFAVVISQHMPAGFTKAFAERLNRSSHFDVKEAEDGDLVLPGSILIAPGGKNMVFEIRGGQVTVCIVEPSESDRYVPSVDAMLKSCAGIYCKRVVAVILTGMGNDGSSGIRSIKEHGGCVLAESEDTAIVYGMPREAVATGVVDRSVTLDKIADEILLQGGFN
ncbi:MAG: chemotaxis response regulator protein-glutamate methylesterase [Desulfuromonadaceae bacterium]|nr:chemotaxis response regulator protein-glutamate methylesterase [Desulfuromonadaceae bacterium]MDD5105421.1 chemotaxis response regulator protein-glutamate methylesterase [Desulfuromonadaceae bacterium]